MSSPVERSQPPACPVCRRPAVAALLPFCSKTCRDRDLLAWLGGHYAIPGPPAGGEEDGGR